MKLLIILLFISSSCFAMQLKDHERVKRLQAPVLVISKNKIRRPKVIVNPEEGISTTSQSSSLALQERRLRLLKLNCNAGPQQLP